MRADPDAATLYRTHIEGFDEALDGGIPQGHVVLVSGSPGTMKSSIGYYMLFMNATQGGIPGAYITLEQSRESLLFQMTRLGLKGAPERRLQVVDLAAIRKNVGVEDDGSWLEILKRYITHLRSAYKVELLVIDSLQAMKVLGSMDESRSGMFRFMEWLRELGTTAIILDEVAGAGRLDPGVEDYLSDGIIYLSLVKVGRFDFHRRIRCLKMRGMHHIMSYYSLDFKGGRFMATPPI